MGLEKCFECWGMGPSSKLPGLMMKSYLITDEQELVLTNSLPLVKRGLSSGTMAAGNW